MKYKYVKNNNVSSKPENDSPVKITTEEKPQVQTEEILDFVIDVNSQGDISGKREYNKNSNQNTEKQENIAQQIEISNEVENPSSLSNNTKTENSFLNKFKNKKLVSKKDKKTNVSLEKLDIDFEDNSYNDEISSVELFEEISENLETIEEKNIETPINDKKSFFSKFKKDKSLSETIKIENLEIDTVQEKTDNTDVIIENVKNLDITKSQSNAATKNKLSLFSKFKKNKKAVDLKDIEMPVELSEDEIESAINLFNEDELINVDLNQASVNISNSSIEESTNISTDNQEILTKEKTSSTNLTEETTLNDVVDKNDFTIPKKKSLFDKFKKEKTENLFSHTQPFNTESTEVDEMNNNLIIENISSINETETQSNNYELLKDTDSESKFTESNIFEKLDISNSVLGDNSHLDFGNEPESVIEEDNIDIANTELENNFVESNNIDVNIEIPEKKEKVSFFSKFKKKKANDDISENSDDFLLQTDILPDITLEKDIDNTVINEVDSIEEINDIASENIFNHEEIESVEIPEKKEKVSFFNKFKKKKNLDEFSFDTQSSNTDNIPQMNTFKEDIYLQKEEINNSIENEFPEIVEETSSNVIDDIVPKEEIFNEVTENENTSMDFTDEIVEIPVEKEKVSLFNKFKTESSITLPTPEVDTSTDEIPIASKDKENDDLVITETDLVNDAFSETTIKKEKKSLFGIFKKEKSRSLDELDEITNDTQKEILDLQDIDNTELFETINVKKEEKKKEKSSLFTINKPKKQEKPEIELSYDRFNELGEDFVSEEEFSTTNNFEIENTIPKQKNKFVLPAFLTGLSFGKKNNSKQLIEETFDLQEDTENLTIQNSQNFDNNFSDLNVNNENSLFDTNDVSDNNSLFEDSSNLSNTSLPNQQIANVGNTISLNKKSLLLILLAIILIVTFTTVLTTFIISKLVVPSTEPTVVENTIDQEAIDKAVQEALNKMNYFNEVNNTTSKVDTPISNNDKELELPPQLGIDFETSNIEENKNNIASKMFNLGNLSFSYPMEWVENMSFSLKPTPENVSNIIMLGVDNDSLKHVNNMRVTTETLLQAISAKEYVEKTEQVLKENYTNFKLRNSKELTVSGREAPTRIYSYEQNGENYFQYQVYVADKTKIYIITFTSSARLFESNYKVYNQILETIRI